MEADPVPLTNAEIGAFHPQTSAEIVKSRLGGFEFKNGYPIAEVAKKLYEPPTFIRALTLWFLLFSALPLFARDSTDVLIVKHGDHSTYEIKGMNNGDADSYERPSCGTRYGPQGFSYHGKIQCSAGCHP